MSRVNDGRKPSSGSSARNFFIRFTSARAAKKSNLSYKSRTASGNYGAPWKCSTRKCCAINFSTFFPLAHFSTRKSFTFCAAERHREKRLNDVIKNTCHKSLLAFESGVGGGEGKAKESNYKLSQFFFSPRCPSSRSGNIEAVLTVLDGWESPTDETALQTRRKLR